MNKRLIISSLALALLVTPAAARQRQGAKHLQPAPGLMQRYANANWKYFAGQLPEEMPVYWGRKIRDGDQALLEAVLFVEDERGRQHPALIVIERKLRDGYADYAALLLLHAMAHIASGERSDAAPAFQAEMRRLAAAGALDSIW